MGIRRPIGKIARKTPGTRGYFKQKELSQLLSDLQEENVGLKQSIDRLETRNAEWAAEVRELRGDDTQLEIVWPVAPEDLISADLSKKYVSNKKTKAPFTINWVLPPMGPVSGGHSDIFRTIQYLERAGHTCRIYYYDSQQNTSLNQIKKYMKSYPKVSSELFYNTKPNDFLPSDAIFATNWFTAYPVYNAKNVGKKFYYVQDFEPFFDPVGSYSTFAENTYKFGFYGITLGRWLTKKLSSEYKMECDYFDLGVDSKEYSLINTGDRKKILYYARPVTPRRGFELGILALQIFHEKHPEYEINFIGWDVSRYHIPFPYVNHGILNHDKLNKLYNECAAGLVLSFTNMSLLPLEMLAAGCVPVVNRAEHTEMASYSANLAYADPTPQALADKLKEIVENKNLEKLCFESSEAAKQFEWDASNKKVEAIVTRELLRLK